MNHNKNVKDNAHKNNIYDEKDQNFSSRYECANMITKLDYEINCFGF